MKTVFLRVLEAEDKATALLDALRGPARAECPQRFDVDLSSFASVPRSPFAYWVSERLRRLFKELPPFEAEGRTAKQGLATTDDFRFVRGWWAVPSKSAYVRWFPFAKGGTVSPFFADIFLMVDWWKAGAQSWAIYEARRDVVGGIIKNPDFYFRPGLTWPLRTQSGLWMRAMPSNCVFSHRGPSVFVNGHNHEVLTALLSVVISSSFRFLAELQTTFGSYEVGVVQRTPVPKISNSDRAVLAMLAGRAWSLKRLRDTRLETSHAFSLPALLQFKGNILIDRTAAWGEDVRRVESELASIQTEIDERCFELYGVDELDRRAISEGFAAGISETQPNEDVAAGEGDIEDSENGDLVADASKLAAEMLSWAVGVAFGRFDVRLATGARALPAEPEPFDPLPVCSPGMLTGEHGLPLARPTLDYPLGFPETGVLVDDPGHGQDLKSALRAVVGAVFGAGVDRWWNDIASLLDPKSHDLRVWLAGSFFEHHLKRYSKSRRMAPIYWQLATPSASYSVWAYAHRLTGDSFFQIQKDIVAPKLMHEESELARFVRDAGSTPTSEQRKHIAAQESFVAELRAFRDEIARVAPLWTPNLDDGVVLTTAPLWRLFPHHKSWQKELKGYWDELCAGKYNWSHLAMHLWPERVVPNCATDRSIAIAHDLEQVFWAEDAKGKWKPRSQATRPIAELIAERSSPAVKAALKSLLEAPVAAGKGRKNK